MILFIHVITEYLQGLAMFASKPAKNTCDDILSHFAKAYPVQSAAATEANTKLRAYKISLGSVCHKVFIACQTPF